MNLRPVLLAALLTTAACSSDDPQSTPSVDPTSTTTTATEPVASSSSTQIPTSTTENSATSSIATATTEAVTTNSATTIAGVDDWLGVVQTLGQRRQDIYGAPDLSSIPAVCGDQSQCAEQLNVQIGDLANKGWKVIGADPYVVLGANVEKFDGDSIETSLLVTVVAVIQRPAEAGTIVDSSGAVIADVQAQTTPGHNSKGRFLLARVGPVDDPWRLVSQDTLPEVPA